MSEDSDLDLWFLDGLDLGSFEGLDCCLFPWWSLTVELRGTRDDRLSSLFPILLRLSLGLGLDSEL